MRVDTDAPPTTVADDALWAIAVPFTAKEPLVSVETATQERWLKITPGRYQVTFQARPGTEGHAYRIDMGFKQSSDPRFAILKQGSLGSAGVLRTRSRRQ